ncbi:MAG: NADH-quinone oxidoreductase subunit L [bacterium]
MMDLLWIAPFAPLASFLVLSIAGPRLSRGMVATLGAGSVGLAALVSIGIAFQFLSAPPPGHEYTQVLWRWVSVDGFRPDFALRLDPLSLVMLLVVTVVGFFIHLYSTEYMADDARYSRFFAYMNLFVGSMLFLVLGDNLLLLYLGWEGVGLCSFLLIGFWYHEQVNADAARKAFVVTRIGDTAMALGLFMLFLHMGTIRIPELLSRVQGAWPLGSPLATTAALLLLGGAVGKSAQLPLQTWLPDAMAGPTPVSALIHAATMVTAGVYLIARMHVLYDLSPVASSAVAAVGAITLLLSGFTALVQRDIKRVLAYSTISQIGYMFLALGVGAYSAAIFHLMTHAFFKALLFLAAGAVILALHHEQDIFKMGGLKKDLPGVYWTFLIGGAALAGFPLVTAGFYSKDLILWEAWSSPRGGPWLWAAGALGAFLTALYTFRLIFIVFFGSAKTHVHHPPGSRIMIPLTVLALLSVVGGLVEVPGTLGGKPLFSDFIAPSFAKPAAAPMTSAESMSAAESTEPGASASPATGAEPVEHEDMAQEGLFQALAAAIALLGIALAAGLYLKGKPSEEQALPGLPRPLQRFWFSGWGFDAIYDALLVRPIMAIARLNKSDFVDLVYRFLAASARAGHGGLSETQTGRLRWYAAALGLGALAVLTLAVFL